MYDLVPFTEDRRSEVVEFNRRLLAGGLDVALMYPETPIPRFPRREGVKVYQQYFLLADTESYVRGGFILTQEEWSLHGERAWVAHLKLPISEGAVDRRFKSVGPQVFQSALEQQPNLYTVGMGGFQTAVTRRLKSLGWSMRLVPLCFKLRDATVFLKTSPYLRKSPVMRFASDLAANSGLSSFAFGAWHHLHAMKAHRVPNISVEVTPVFSSWADQVWEQSRDCYGLIAPRDSGTLNARYPAEEPRFLRLKFSREGKAFGWAVVLDTQMRANKYFGDARVGSIVDCLARPEDAELVIANATKYLEDRGVDLVVSNQTHGHWLLALSQAGYLRGPSNYVFALSPKLAALVHPFENQFSEFFVNRGDGAGPERLME